MKRGFTLIELLVVVLIIGILSAVALPQYTKAVNKSRFTEVQVNFSTMIKTAQLYLMANGIPALGESTVYLSGTDGVGDIKISGKETSTGVDTKLGTYYLFCSYTSCMAQFINTSGSNKWFDGFIYIDMFNHSPWRIYVQTNNPDNKKMVCQWWNNGGFGSECK